MTTKVIIENKGPQTILLIRGLGQLLTSKILHTGDITEEYVYPGVHLEITEAQ